MGTMASQITSLTIIYSSVYLGADQRKHQSSASLAFVKGICRWQVKIPRTKGQYRGKRLHLMTSSWFWFWGCIRLWAHYVITIASLCKVVWKHWTFKMVVRVILSIVWLRWGLFSLSYFMRYTRLCVFSWPISDPMIWRIFVIHVIIIKWETWFISHCLRRGHRTLHLL